MKLFRTLLAGLIFGAATFGGLLTAQQIVRSVQLSQDSTGVFGVDANSNLYLQNNRHLLATNNASTAPSLGTCAGGTLVAGSTDFSGQVSGSSGTSCVVNFGQAWVTAPRCVTSGSTSSATTGPVSNTTTTAALTMTVAVTGAGVFTWLCNSVS